MENIKWNVTWMFCLLICIYIPFYLLHVSFLFVICISLSEGMGCRGLHSPSWAAHTHIKLCSLGDTVSQLVSQPVIRVDLLKIITKVYPFPQPTLYYTEKINLSLNEWVTWKGARRVGVAWLVILQLTFEFLSFIFSVFVPAIANTISFSHNRRITITKRQLERQAWG